jgi:hypothetical protein
MNQPPTIFTKAIICLEQRFEHELDTKMALFPASNTIHNNFDQNSAIPPLKIWNAADYEKCVLRKDEQLLYWLIFECLVEFWRTRQKVQRGSKTLGVGLGV